MCMSMSMSIGCMSLLAEYCDSNVSASASTWGVFFHSLMTLLRRGCQLRPFALDVPACWYTGVRGVCLQLLEAVIGVP